MRVRMYKYDDRLKIEELELLSIVIKVVGWLPYGRQSPNFLKYTRSMTFVFIYVKLRMLVTIVKNANQKTTILSA